MFHVKQDLTARFSLQTDRASWQAKDSRVWSGRHDGTPFF
jgi:hypothetical protein